MPDNPAALILDFGGVVTRTLFETHALTGETLGLSPGRLTWRGPFDPGDDELWQSMQRDEISERDYWLERTRQVSHMIGQNWTAMTDFVKAARGASPEKIIRPEFYATLDRVSQTGIRLAILSNELDLFCGAEFRSKLPFLKQFDVIEDATYTNRLKPDSAA